MSLPVVRRFVQSVSDQAVGMGVIRGVKPDQQLVMVISNCSYFCFYFISLVLPPIFSINIMVFIVDSLYDDHFGFNSTEVWLIMAMLQIVHDELVKLMGGEVSELQFAKSGPTVILLAGLQGVGKTTVCAKLACYLKKQVCFLKIQWRF